MSNLRGYTVKECAHDVADLRTALGYDKITLVGTSFGSQWSFAVMRQHPEIVARALLSGVEPLDHGYDMPSYVFAAVQRMWRTLDEDPRFQPYLPEGGMAEAARIVVQRLEQEPLRVEYTDQESGERKSVAVIGPEDFPWNDPTRILELYHGQTQPLKWVMALAGNSRRRRVSLIGPLIDSSLGVTPQRRYRLWTDPATRYLGRGNFAPYLATADIWPSPDVGDEFRTPDPQRDSGGVRPRRLGHADAHRKHVRDCTLLHQQPLDHCGARRPRRARQHRPRTAERLGDVVGIPPHRRHGGHTGSRATAAVATIRGANISAAS